MSEKLANLVEWKTISETHRIFRCCIGGIEVTLQPYGRKWVVDSPMLAKSQYISARTESSAKAEALRIVQRANPHTAATERDG